MLFPSQKTFGETASSCLLYISASSLYSSRLVYILLVFSIFLFCVRLHSKSYIAVLIYFDGAEIKDTTTTILNLEFAPNIQENLKFMQIVLPIKLAMLCTVAYQHSAMH